MSALLSSQGAAFLGQHEMSDCAISAEKEHCEHKKEERYVRLKIGVIYDSIQNCESATCEEQERHRSQYPCDCFAPSHVEYAH
jgi:hypothetical protein